MPQVSPPRTMLLALLLLTNSRAAAPAAPAALDALAASDGRSCVSADELTDREVKFRRNYWNKLSVARVLPAPPGDERTCERAAKEMRGDHSARSTSPWRYSVDRDDGRIPAEIPVAKCLCEGCIIDQHEDSSYNSVPVYVRVKVLQKSLCPGDASKYVVKNDFLQVAVACTCVVPNYSTPK